MPKILGYQTGGVGGIFARGDLGRFPFPEGSSPEEARAATARAKTQVASLAARIAEGDVPADLRTAAERLVAEFAVFVEENDGEWSRFWNAISIYNQANDFQSRAYALSQSIARATGRGAHVDQPPEVVTPWEALISLAKWGAAGAAIYYGGKLLLEWNRSRRPARSA